MSLIFKAIRVGGDNLSYVIGCSAKGVAAVVDPADAGAVIDYCESQGLKIQLVLNTHSHPDHTGGNAAVARAAGAEIRAHAHDQVGSVSRPLGDGETIEVGEVSIEVVHTPGHTAGGLCFKAGGKLITGDTVFLAGAGNVKFGGNVKDLFASFEQKIVAQFDEVEVWPGHDYGANNLGFALSLEPDNAAAHEKLKQYDQAGADAVVGSTIGEERRYNPFFRCREPELIAGLKGRQPGLNGDDPFEVFRTVRELRNSW